MEFSNPFTARVKAVPLFPKIDTGSWEGVQDTVLRVAAPKVTPPAPPPSSHDWSKPGRNADLPGSIEKAFKEARNGTHLWSGFPLYLPSSFLVTLTVEMLRFDIKVTEFFESNQVLKSEGYGETECLWEMIFLQKEIEKRYLGKTIPDETPDTKVNLQTLPKNMPAPPPRKDAFGKDALWRSLEVHFHAAETGSVPYIRLNLRSDLDIELVIVRQENFDLGYAITVKEKKPQGNTWTREGMGIAHCHADLKDLLKKIPMVTAESSYIPDAEKLAKRQEERNKARDEKLNSAKDMETIRID